MRVKVKRLHPDAVIPFKTYNSDFCYDLVAVSCEEVAPNVYKYGFGMAFQIDRTSRHDIGLLLDLPYDDQYECNQKMAFSNCRSGINLSIDIRPRSSVWKTGMITNNCTSTIDEDYTGEVSAVFYHVMPDMPRYKVGDKIAQLKIGNTLPIEFTEVDELEHTERGNGAYGHTDKINKPWTHY